jgi:hypothetical protein
MVVGLWMWAASASAGPADVPVTFQITTNTTFGMSVFVLGSIPQLYSWNPVNAIKLVPNNCFGTACTWSATIAILQGTSYQYKFVERNDCATCYSYATNIVYEMPYNTNRVGATLAEPSPPWSGKTAFYLSSWSSVSLLYSNTTTGSFALQPMIAVGPGRSVSEKLWRVDGINHAGETNLIFVLTDNLGHYDNLNGVGGANYETPLDAFLLQDGQIYNYWPASSVSTNQVVSLSITPTNGLAARTVRVYLPRGYAQNTTKSYPVLYMHDGQNLFLGMEGLSGFSWGADTNANNLIQLGKMRETVIVGVDNSSDRFCEYAPPTCSYSECSSPVGNEYVSFLADQLKPVIDSQYRTLTDADDTGALGSSLGGLISAYMGWQRSDIYHKIGCMSSSFDICSPITTGTNFPIRVYLDSGNMDAQGDVGSSDDLLYTMGERDNLINDGHVFNNDLDHTIGYGQWHSEQWWAVRLPRVYKFLFPTSDEPDTILDTATPPRITNVQATTPSNVVTWTSFHLRSYAVQGVTNQQYSSSMTWSDLITATTPEPLLWDYPSAGVSNIFNFLRVRELSVTNWPNGSGP